MPGVKKTVWKFDGRSNEAELHRRLSFFMLRRTKLDVKMELPPKTRLIVDVNIPSRNRYGFSEELFKSKRAMRRALDLAADGKVKPAIELIHGDLEGGHKVIAFTHRKLVAEHIIDSTAMAGYDCGLIHSGVSRKKRETLIQTAKESSSAFLIAATIDSTSTGIDLSFADVANVVELPYEWHVLAQAEGRLHRYGQQRPVLVRYVVGRGTGDELILQMLLAKIDTFEKVVGPLDDRMGAELNSAPTGQDALDELYESMIAKDAEERSRKGKKK